MAHRITPDLDQPPYARTAIMNLFRNIKIVEDSDGSWPGDDVVDVLAAWFAGLGIDVDVPYGALPDSGERGVPCCYCPGDLWPAARDSTWQDAAGGIHCGRHLGRSCAGLDCPAPDGQHEQIRVRIPAGWPGVVVSIVTADDGIDRWEVVDGNIPDSSYGDLMNQQPDRKTYLVADNRGEFEVPAAVAARIRHPLWRAADCVVLNPDR